MMSQFSSKSLLAGALIVLAAALFLLNLGGYLAPAQEVLLAPLAALQNWISERYFTVRDLLISPRDVATLQARIAELEAENSRLQDEIIVLQEQANEAEQLGALLNFARGRPERDYLAASVIGFDPSPFIRSINLSAGTDHGVLYGMPVVTDDGLVGRIIETSAQLSRAQLITDPELAVNVRLQESDADGVLVAQANGELWVDLIDQDAEVVAGELVLTSGLGGLFPDDVVVGQVLSVRRRDFELFQQAVIEPAVDLANLEIVLVITDFQAVGAEAAQ